MCNVAVTKLQGQGLWSYRIFFLSQGSMALRWALFSWLWAYRVSYKHTSEEKKICVVPILYAYGIIFFWSDRWLEKYTGKKAAKELYA